VRVGEVGPVGNAVHAARVLRHYRIADVRKLTVLKNEEVCARARAALSGRRGRRVRAGPRPGSARARAARRLCTLRPVLQAMSGDLYQAARGWPSV